MKTLIINGGPRKNGSTYELLEQAMKGASEAGADVELVNLYDSPFNGCVSCFACKLKNAKTNGVCAVKDSLRPVLEKAHEADVIIIGSPIYFDYPTGVVRSFMERLMYPILSYNPKIDNGEMEMGLLDKVVPTAMIYTMGSTDEAAKAFSPALDENRKFLEMLFGYNETIYSYNTIQFKDYSRYDVMEGVEEARKKQREEHFPDDLKAAYELGKRLVNKAKA